MKKNRKHKDTNLSSTEDELITADDKGITEYVFLISNCLLIAFSEFMFGFDVGLIGGFFKMDNFSEEILFLPLWKKGILLIY